MKPGHKHFLKNYIFPLLGILALIGLFWYYQRFKESREQFILARKALARKDFYHGSEHLKEAIRLDNDYADAYILYAKIYTEILNDFTTGNSITTKAIDAGCTGSVLYFLKGKSLYKSGKRQSSVEWFLKAKKLTPAIDSASFYLAEVSLARHKTKEALAYYSEFLKTNAGSIESLEGRGKCYASLKMFNPAIEDFTRALEKTKSGQLFFLRAKVHFQAADSTAGCTDIANAISHDYEPAKAVEVNLCY